MAWCEVFVDRGSELHREERRGRGLLLPQIDLRVVNLVLGYYTPNQKKLTRGSSLLQFLHFMKFAQRVSQRRHGQIAPPAKRIRVYLAAPPTLTQLYDQHDTPVSPLRLPDGAELSIQQSSQPSLRTHSTPLPGTSPAGMLSRYTFPGRRMSPAGAPRTAVGWKNTATVSAHPGLSVCLPFFSPPCGPAPAYQPSSTFSRMLSQCSVAPRCAHPPLTLPRQSTLRRFASSCSCTCAT